MVVLGDLTLGWKKREEQWLKVKKSLSVGGTERRLMRLELKKQVGAMGMGSERGQALSAMAGSGAVFCAVGRN